MRRSYLAPAYFTWLIMSLFYSFQFFLRSSPNAMSDQLMTEFHIDATMFGWISAAYYIPYSVLQIPLGISLDVWGPKKILRIGTVLCVIGALLFGCAVTFPMVILGRCLIGMGAAVSFIGSVRMNTMWFSAAHIAFAVGLLSAVGKLGGGAANAFLPYLMSNMPSWHYVILTLCLLGALLSLLICLFIKNGPDDQFTSAIKTISFAEIKKQFLTVIKSPMIWMMGLFGYALYLNLSVFGDSYSIDFLCHRMGITRNEAGELASLVLIGSAFGALTLSYLSDRLKQRRIFLRAASFFTIIFSGLVFFGPTFTPTIMAIWLFSLGFFSGGQVLVFVIAAESAPPQLTGIATGVVNCILMLGGALHNPLIGWLLNSFWRGEIYDGHPVYSLLNYRIAFASIFVCFVGAFIISLFMSETHPLRRKIFALN